MPKFNQLSSKQKNEIVSNNAGMSSREIGEAVGCANSTVCRFLKKFANTGETGRKKGTGPKRKTTKADDRFMKQQCIENRFLTAVDIQVEHIARGGVDIGVHTVRRRLREGGLWARGPAKKPFLNARMRNARFEWTSTDWENVIFSDESKFDLFGSDGMQYVRRRSGERVKANCIQKTVKHPASQMMWGCFAYHVVGEIAYIDGYVNAEKYICRNFKIPSFALFRKSPLYIK